MKKYVVITEDNNLVNNYKLKLFSTKENAINFYNEEVKRLFSEYKIIEIIDNEKTSITKIDDFCGVYNFKQDIDFTIKIEELEEE